LVEFGFESFDKVADNNFTVYPPSHFLVPANSIHNYFEPGFFAECADEKRDETDRRPAALAGFPLRMRWPSQHWTHRSLTKAEERRPQFREDSIVDLRERDDTVADRKNELITYKPLYFC
jgi:hypothetical protein